MCSARWSAAATVVLVLLQLVCLSRVLAQGHYVAGDVLTLKRAPSAYTALSAIRKGSANWRNAHRVAQTAAGKKQCAYLCSADLTDEGQKGIANMATAPQVFNTTSVHGRVRVVSAVVKQECGICVAHAVVAAAETAAAVRLQRSLGSDSMSAAHFYFCGYSKVNVGYGPTCESAGLTIEKGVSSLCRLVEQGQVPLNDRCFKFVDTGSWIPTQDCKANSMCEDNSPLLGQGSLTYLPLSSTWQIQKHIRRFGSVVCPITLFPSLRKTLDIKSDAVYNGPEPGEQATGSHAVQVVGYDNDRQAWLARNSWGTDFGMAGYFWVNFSAPGMCDGSDTFGLTFTPSEVQTVAGLQPVPGKPRCFTYKAQPGDYPEKLVDKFGLGLNGLQRLVQDNLDSMPELDQFTPGAPLLICSPDPRVLPVNKTYLAPVPKATLANLTASAVKKARLYYLTRRFTTEALFMAASPIVFDGRSAWRGLSVMGTVKDQGDCGTAVAFAVLAAAQTAAAVALNTSLPADSLSEHELFFCLDSGFSSTCSSGMSLKDGLQALFRAQRAPESIAVDECVPYQPARGAGACQRKCTRTAAQLWRGTWKGTQFGSIADMQRHILFHGSIICGLPLYSDNRPFYKANPGGVYRPAANATFEGYTAIQVVGYDNARNAWLYKQSWGPGFAMRGFAWVSIDIRGVCTPVDTWGLVFTPDRPVPPPGPLRAVPGRPGCFHYRAQQGDYVAKLAYQFELPLVQLLLDNAGVVQDPSKLTPGTLIRLCGITPTTGATPTSSSVGRPPVTATAAAGPNNSSKTADRPPTDG